VPALVAAVLAAELLVVARHPGAPAATLFAIALGAVMLVTLAVAGLAAWRPAADPDGGTRRLGTWLGIGLGLLWMVEIGVNNVFPADRIALGSRDAIDDAIWALISLLTLGAGAVAARRAGSVAAGTSIGLWSGIVSGLLAYLGALLVAVLFPGAAERDPDLLSKFPASGYPDLPTDAAYSLIGPWPIGGGAAHLWLLGIGAGLLLGALGGLIGSIGSPRRAAPSR
jgi:hypothetical protein